ncbi:hypothetical protein P2318_07490 [Myxococcaceae bacterium GXIMD 01537]
MSVQEAVVVVLVVAIVVGVPFMALSLRICVKLVDAWIRLKEAQIAPSAEVNLLRERVAHLERVLERHGLMEHRLVAPSQPLMPERLPGVIPERERV